MHASHARRCMAWNTASGQRDERNVSIAQPKVKTETLRGAKTLRGRPPPFDGGTDAKRPPAKSHVSHFSGGVTRRWTRGEESERWKGERWTSGRGTRGTKGATCASVNALFRGFSLNWWICKQLCESRRRWTAGGEKKKKRRKRATSSVNAAAPLEPFSHFFHQDTPTLKTETLFIRGT